jgi:alanine-glyoxylate transaminase/serine-glyoxylate transaminase/serine-pyruvate transaminase
MLWDGLDEMGIAMHVPKEHRLPSLNTPVIPDGVDGKAVCAYLMENYNIEIFPGMGRLAGKVWRIGLMGYNSRAENVLLLLAAMENALAHV